jgi:hypothetical protein
MKIRQLIRKLERFDLDLDVCVISDDPECGDAEADITTVDLWDGHVYIGVDGEVSPR